MELSYNWLHELLPGLPAAAVVGDRLTSIGLELENVREFAPSLDPLMIVAVVSVRPHPEREKLRLVTVSDAISELTVVCGASNVPEPGGLVVLAPLGATLPAVGMTLEPRKLGGIVSEGMLCSEIELGVGSDSDGILVFEPGRFRPGTRFYEAFPTAHDTIFSIGVTPNRPDALGHLGVARDLGAAFGLMSASAEATVDTASQENTGDVVTVENQATDLCPRYGCLVVRNVSVHRSPEWLRWRLTSLGVRPVSNVVDVTNLVMLESGNPMHAFDLARVTEGRIVVRRAATGENITTLDAEVRALTPDDLVIADSTTALALAGIMGGSQSGIDETTTDVLLEAAYFAPTAIRRTARRLGMGSDSSYRFERGVDWGRLDVILAQAAKRLSELASGTPARSALFSEGAAPVQPVIRLEHARLCALLGYDPGFERSLEILKSLEFELVAQDETGATVRVPSHRPDVSLEADLVEEVLRICGLDAVPTELPAIRPQPPSTASLLSDRARNQAASCGLSEAITYSFVSELDLEKVRAPEPVVRLKNPMSGERSVLCTSLLPGLLESLGRAQRRGEQQVRLFTVATRFLHEVGSTDSEASLKSRPRAPGDAERLPREHLSLAAVLAGDRCEYLKKPKPLDVFDAKGVAVELVERLTKRTARVEAATLSGGPLEHLHPRGAARIFVDETEVGQFGPLHPDVRDAFELQGAPLIVELDLEAIEALGRATPKFRRVPRLPAVTRDVAVETPQSMSAEEVRQAIRVAAGDLCESVDLFDLFESEALGDRRSLAFRVVYRDPKATTDPENAQTLTDKRVDKEHARVVDALGRIGAQLRA